MICRLCLLKCKDLIEIFDEQGRNLNIDSIILQHFGIQLGIDDEISTKICTECWLEIENFHAFFIDIKKVQDKLYEKIYSSKLIKTKKFNRISENLSKNQICNYYDNEETDFNSSDVSDFIERDFSNVGDIDIFIEPPRFNRSKIDRKHKSKDKKIVLARNKDNEVLVVEAAESQVLSHNEENCNAIDFCTVDYSTCDVEVDDEYISTSFNRSDAPDLSTILQRKDISITPIEKTKIKQAIDEPEVQIRNYVNLICDICSKKFEIFSELKKHCREEHNTNGYAVCCNQQMYKRSQLLNHIMEHISVDMKRSEKETEIETNGHLSNSDYDYEIFSEACHLCRGVFNNKKEFENHIREHQMVLVNKMQCKQCGALIKNRKQLRSHVQMHINENRDLTCTLCGKKAVSDTALHRHLRNVHYKEKKYQCNLCDKAFKWAINLKEHMAIHTGLSLYKCPYCSRNFNASSNMHAHRKKMHPIEWEKDRQRRPTTTQNDQD